MDLDKEKAINTNRVRRNEVLDINKLSKKQVMYIKWFIIRRFNLKSEMEIQRELTIKLYQNSDNKAKFEC
jgi:hypothetical protein